MNDNTIIPNCAALSLPYYQEDATVTYEDQQKINKFARINASLQELKEELSVKQVCTRSGLG